MRAPRRLWPVAAFVLLLASCKGEPDFDERYRQQSADIEAAANNMQQDLENRMAASNLIQTAPPANDQTGATGDRATGGDEGKR
ncbi:MAG: hypothetical protein AB7E05_16400 [Sphingobium sp.]